MSTSQNGWQGIESGSDERLVRIPKIIGRVRGGDVAVILTDLVDQFDTHVEDVDLGADDWGHAYRAVREGASLSNHASGTAIDLNATRHPLGKVGTFTATQVAALREILARYGGVIRWGGDYSGRKDEMHFEINASAAQVAAVAARLRAGSAGAGQAAKPTTPGTTTTIRIPTQEEAMLLNSDAYRDREVLAVLCLNGSWVELRNQGEVDNLAKTLGPVREVTDATLDELIREGRGAYKTVTVRK